MRHIALLSLSVLSGVACSARSHSDENLQSVAWVQTSTEYRALARQSYVQATQRLDAALADPRSTAALEQKGDYERLPPAVVLDVDETVLDNSPYQARLVLDERAYDTASWQAWCKEERAAAIPGALEFTRDAYAKGVTVFYVTNRRHEVEEATRNNLRALGFPLSEERDTILTRGEGAWESSDKTSRRAAIAAEYRILLLLGDNLGDFVAIEGALPDARADLYERYRGYWGQRWIVLPNPLYGSWEGALFGFDYGLSMEERSERKRRSLRTR